MDAETFRTRFAETFAERMTAFADDLADSIVELISDESEDDAVPKGKKDERNAAPAPSAAATAAQLRSLRDACKRNGREAEFKALEASGADISELRSLLVASIRTGADEIDTTQRPSSGKRGGGLMAFSETARGGKAAK